MRLGNGRLDDCRGMELPLIQPGKLNQNAEGKLSVGRLRDKCFNEHWFPTSCARGKNVGDASTTKTDPRPQSAA